MSDPPFSGWPQTAIEFFEGLELDNCKTFWLDHKDVYEQDVKAPMLALLGELTDEFGEPRLFRPYRDVRFSRDKTPYKTSIAAMIGTGYVGLSARGLEVGAGFHQMSAGQLDRYRAAVAADRSGAQLERVVRELRAVDIEVRSFDELKTAPRRYPKEHPRIELLRYKGVVAMRSWPPGPWLASAEAKRRIEEFLHTAAPLVDLLTTHVGADEGS
jgi:uncharacterized protein (TIGR02453 family)